MGAVVLAAVPMRTFAANADSHENKQPIAANVENAAGGAVCQRVKPNLSSLPTSKTQAYYDPNNSLLDPVEVRILPAHCRIPGTLAVSMIVTHLGMRRV